MEARSDLLQVALAQRFECQGLAGNHLRVELKELQIGRERVYDLRFTTGTVEGTGADDFSRGWQQLAAIIGIFEDFWGERLCKKGGGRQPRIFSGQGRKPDGNFLPGVFMVFGARVRNSSRTATFRRILQQSLAF